MYIKLVIFDMDGLMFDTERIAFEAWEKAFCKYGYVLTKEPFEKTIGLNFEKTKAIYLQHFGKECLINEIAKDRLIIADELIHQNGVQIKEGLYDILRYFKELNIKMAVATSTSRERAYSLIGNANIIDYFECIVCGDEIEKCKPDPDIYLKVADNMGIKPKNCLVLEDSEAGISAAYSAGMVPIMIPDIKEPDEAIEKILFKKLRNLNELRGMFESAVLTRE